MRPLHTRILLALGIGWALDSFEVQIIGSVLTPLGRDFGLLGPDGAITPGAVSLIWVVWFAGLMTGATAFGWLADRYGRKRLFVATLVMYSIATVVSAFSPTFLVFLLFRFITATGVGGEYSAVTSAIAEFMPTRRRGAATAATMNFWSVGEIVAGLVGIFFLNSVVADQLALGGISLAAWRLCLLAGAAAVYALIARRAIPESPRWLASQGRRREANVIITQISGIADDHTDLIGAPHRRSLRAQIAELWRNWRPQLLYGMVLDFSGSAAGYGLFTFLASYVLIPKQVNASSAAVPLFLRRRRAWARVGVRHPCGVLHHRRDRRAAVGPSRRGRSAWTVPRCGRPAPAPVACGRVANLRSEPSIGFSTAPSAITRVRPIAANTARSGSRCSAHRHELVVDGSHRGGVLGPGV